MAPTPQKDTLSLHREDGENRDKEENVKAVQSYPNDMYTVLITKAPYEVGDEMDLIPFEEIPWIDKELIEHSLKFHRKNVFTVILSCTVALMMGFSVKPNSAVLLKTGKLLDSEISFKRYVSTMQRIGKFFMVTFDQAKSYEALNTVRKMHSLATKRCRKIQENQDTSIASNKHVHTEAWKKELALAIRKDLAHIDTSSAPKQILHWNPPVPISQFDMVITQFGFFATIYMFPEAFGIKNAAEELKGVIHTWAIFGRLLGIKDEYNICIKPDPIVFKKLYTNILLESLKTMDETVITIQDAFMTAFNKRLPFITYKGMVFAALGHLEDFKGENLWKLMTWKDKFSFYILQLWSWGLVNSFIFKIFMNVMTGLWLQLMFWLHLNTSLFS